MKYLYLDHEVQDRCIHLWLTEYACFIHIPTHYDLLDFP